MSQFIQKYTGSMLCVAGTAYLGSAITLGTILQMKTKSVKLSINSTTAFDFTYGDSTFIDTTATYTFSEDCVLAISALTEVV